VFASAHGQFVGILVGFFLVQDLTYGIYRSNPEMDIGMYVETVNAHFPYELAIVFVCFAFTVVMAILYKSAISDFPQLIQAVVSQYFSVRLITLFYYISLPLLKDYRCEMVQDAGEQRYCTYPRCDVLEPSCSKYEYMYELGEVPRYPIHIKF